MSTAFDTAFGRLMSYEGGYSNDPDDPGGETNFGISKRSFPEVDIANLTEEQAKVIYLEKFWIPLRLNHVVEPNIAAEIFEQGVNLGNKMAVKNAQSALNYLGGGLKVDGDMGPVTVGAINGFKDQHLLFRILNGIQFCYYLNLVKVNLKQRKYARGWLRRIEV